MTTTLTINDLYNEIVADLVPFYDNQVLLPNNMLITRSFNIVGSAGNTVTVPLHRSYTPGSVVGEGNSIVSGASSNVNTDAATITVNKRGAATRVSQEALEDGGAGVVSSAITAQLSGAIAQSTDIAGFQVMIAGSEQSITDIANVDGNVHLIVAGGNVATLANVDLGVVFSPEAMAYASKREPTLQMFHDVDFDRYDMVASVRNGFTQVRPEFISVLACSDQLTESNANLTLSLENVAQAVTRLRVANAPTDVSGFLMAVITPVQEYHLATQLNSVSSGTVGDLSTIGNQALVDGLIGQAVGCRFMRSNNLPQGILSA